MNVVQQHVSDEFLKARPALMKMAVSLTRDPDRARDLLHDTYLRAVTKADQYEMGTKVVAWATTMMRNLWISDGRLLKNRTHCDLTVEDMPTRPATQMDRLVLREAVRDLRKVIPTHRRMLLLIGLEGMTYDEVARLVGCKEGTVKSGVSRARSQLRGGRAA